MCDFTEFRKRDFLACNWLFGLLVNLKYFVRFADTATENTRDYRFLQSRAVHK